MPGNKMATVIIVAYDGFGDVVCKHDVTSRHDPGIQWIEFQMQCDKDYPHKVTRYEMTVAY